MTERVRSRLSLAQFQNCSVYNQWTESEQLAYLRGSLEKEAGQVLWDYSAESTNSVKKLIRALKERFGGANQADKYRIEVKSRSRRLASPSRIFIRISISVPEPRP